jgi:hypothetical protein
MTYRTIPRGSRLRIPEWQRRGLPLIGWWLAALPHYVLAGVFLGGIGAVWAMHVGIIALLVFAGALVLLVRGAYPRELFDLVLGLNRWALRVVAYAALMTPVYPPFRLDAGEAEPGGLMISTPAERLLPRERSGGALILAAVFGSVAAVLSLGALAGGAAALVFDQTQRDHAGYITTATSSPSTATYALVSNSYRAGTSGDLFVARDMLGTVRIRAEGVRPLFVGIARAADVNAYLGTTQHAVGGGFDLRSSDFRVVGTGAPSTAPAAQRFWAARAAGAGRLTVAWTPRNGNWRIVVMNADASAGVRTQFSVEARFPQLLWIGIGLLGGAAIFALLAGGLLNAATSSTRRLRGRGHC